MKINKELLKIMFFLIIGYILVDITEEEKIESILIKYDNKITVLDNGDIISDQRYKNGKHEICISDCKAHLENNKMEYYSANVRQWGICNCRYLK